MGCIGTVGHAKKVLEGAGGYMRVRSRHALVGNAWVQPDHMSTARPQHSKSNYQSKNSNSDAVNTTATAKANKKARKETLLTPIQMTTAKAKVVTKVIAKTISRAIIVVA